MRREHVCLRCYNREWIAERYGYQNRAQLRDRLTHKTT